MIDKTISFSVAAGAAASNVMPTEFNPTPADGVLEIWGVCDGGISGLTALPTVYVQLGGQTQLVPLPTSVIPVNTFGIALAGPTRNDVILSPVPVAGGTNTQLNLAGGTGATATGRLHIRFRTNAEVAAGL